MGRKIEDRPRTLTVADDFPVELRHGLLEGHRLQPGDGRACPKVELDPEVDRRRGKHVQLNRITSGVVDLTAKTEDRSAYMPPLAGGSRQETTDAGMMALNFARRHLICGFACLQ